MCQTQFTLTPHALERLEERTSISPENIDDLMKQAIDMPYDPKADRACKMFWSIPDDRAYLAFYNRFTLEVVTLYEAYKWIDDTFKGKVYSCRDALGRVVESDLAKVRRRDVRYCMIRAGVEPRPEFTPTPAAVFPPGHGAAHGHGHEYVARIERIEAKPLAVQFMKIPADVPPESVELSEVLEKLCETITRKQIDVAQVKNVILELRRRKRSKDSIEPAIDEIEFDQATLKGVLNECLSKQIGKTANEDLGKCEAA